LLLTYSANPANARWQKAFAASLMLRRAPWVIGVKRFPQLLFEKIFLLASPEALENTRM
jgi:hypothetical protein